MENIEKHIIQHIEETGFYVLHFEPEPEFPGYAHTIGLYGNYNHPELVMFGLDEEVMHIILSNACDRIKAGGVIEADKPYDDFFEGFDIQFIQVNLDEYKGFFGYGLDYYEGHEFPALQLVWPDPKKKFPWDEKFAEEMRPLQPLLI